MESTVVNPVTATPDTLKVVVTNYTAIALSLVVGITLVAVSRRYQRKVGLDDLSLGLSLCTALGASVAVEYAVRRGLGTYIRPGNSSRLNRLSELIYGSDLLLLCSVLLSKLALTRTMRRISNTLQVAKARILILEVAVLVWGLFSIPAIAFQCATPMPWLYLPQRCAGQGAVWIPVLVLSIMTDAWLAFLPWPVVSMFQLSQRQRQVVLGLFASRLLVCIFTVVLLALLIPALHSDNQPRAMPLPTMLKSFVMNASLITAVLPLFYRPLVHLAQAQLASAMTYTPEVERTDSFKMRQMEDEKTKEASIVKEVEVNDDVQKPTTEKSTRLSLAFGKGESKFADEFKGNFTSTPGGRTTWCLL